MTTSERTVPFHVAMRPRTMPGAFPPAERVIAAYQEHLLTQLRAVDDQATSLARWRESIVAELRRCRDARGWVDMHGRRAPLPGDVDALPAGTRPVEGSDLRDAAVAAVYAAGRPVAIGEIVRMLASGGLRPASQPSRRISNALRAPVATGTVVKMGRGVYRAARLP